MARERTPHRESAVGAPLRSAVHVLGMNNALSTVTTWLARDDRLRILVDIAQSATDTATATSFVDRAGSIAALAYALLELAATILIDGAASAPPPARPTPPFDVPALSSHPEAARGQSYDTGRSASHVERSSGPDRRGDHAPPRLRRNRANVLCTPRPHVTVVTTAQTESASCASGSREAADVAEGSGPAGSSNHPVGIVPANFIGAEG